jgi:hypothetical protein
MVGPASKQQLLFDICWKYCVVSLEALVVFQDALLNETIEEPPISVLVKRKPRIISALNGSIGLW